MSLFYREEGDGRPLLVLHGLFGSGDNWLSIAKELSSEFRCILPDLPEHGNSPGGEQLDYPSMSRAVLGLADELDLKSFHIMGHSMGGKTAMALALSEEERCESLVVVDIAPRSYPPRLEGLFKALRGIEALEIHSRSEADKALAKDIENSAVRAFLLKNLVPGNGSYRWRIDLEKIQNNYGHILDWPYEQEKFSKPTLFIKGEKSHYIDEEGEAAIKRFFPSARLESIADSGHWVHSEKREAFTDIVRSFLTSYE